MKKMKSRSIYLWLCGSGSPLQPWRIVGFVHLGTIADTLDFQSAFCINMSRDRNGV